MTQTSILTKLKAELEKEVTTECQVVYILAEIRKAIERANQLESYYALDFYCSFALHTTMSKAGAKRILQRFDQAHPLLIRNEKLPRELQQLIDQTTKLDKFRDELERFLIVNDLPMRLFTEPEAWVKFIHLYASVIDECSLEVKGDDLQLRFIDRVDVHLEVAPKILETEFGNQLLFRICWTCRGKDGKSGDHFVIFGSEPPNSTGPGV